MVAYVVCEDNWFIIPIQVASMRTSLLLCPRQHPTGAGLYSHYREAWRLLRDPDGLVFG